MIPIHYNDCEVFKSPPEAVRAAAEAAGLAERVNCLSRGEACGFEVPQSRRHTA